MEKIIFKRIRKDEREVKEKYLSNVYNTLAGTIIFQWTAKKDNALKIEYSKDSVLCGEISDTLDLLQEEYHKTYNIIYEKVIA